MRAKPPLTRVQIIARLRKEAPFLRDRYGVRRIAVYGSFAKGKQSGKSDVDILVQLTRPLGLEFVALANHLEDVLGRKVDLATFDSLERSLKNPRYRQIAMDIQKSLSYVEG